MTINRTHGPVLLTPYPAPCSKGWATAVNPPTQCVRTSADTRVAVPFLRALVMHGPEVVGGGWRVNRSLLK